MTYFELVALVKSGDPLAASGSPATFVITDEGLLIDSQSGRPAIIIAIAGDHLVARYDIDGEWSEPVAFESYEILCDWAHAL